MASSSSTDSKFPIRRAPAVPREEKSRTSMQDLLTLGNDPFNTQPTRNDLDDFICNGKKPPPRPPPPKSKNTHSYKGFGFMLGKDSKKNKAAATAVVKPLPAAPVATGTLIDFDSPSSSPTFTKLSADLSSVSSTDSGFNYHNKSCLLESGFDDDFDPLSGSERTTPGEDPWSDSSSTSSQSSTKPPIRFQIAPHNALKPRHPANFVMPTIIGPVKLSKPKRPPQPGSVLRRNRINREEHDHGQHQHQLQHQHQDQRDSSPPMPLAPAPPPPPEAINILLNGPSVPPRPSTSGVSETRTPYCVAEYDYQASHPDDLSFKEGDVIGLVEKLNEDWLRGRVQGREGMFPGNYVRVVVPLGCGGGQTPQGSPVSMTVVALFPFVAQTWDDLDLSEGDEIRVSLRINQDWLYGQCNGKMGQFPANFVQDITELVSTS